MIIIYKLTKGDFVRVNMLFLYSRTATKFLIGVALFVLLAYIISVVGEPDHNDWSSLIAPLIFLVVMPISTYLRAAKAYDSNPQARETMTYDIEPNGLQIKGETYSSSFLWKDMHKVTQHKDWMLFWQSNAKVFPLPLAEVWGGQIAEIKDILESNGVKNNLKYTG